MDSQVFEIIVDWGRVASATIVLAFLLNQGYAVFAGFLRRFADRFPFLGGLPAKLTNKVKKTVTYFVAVVMTLAFADLSVLAMPDASNPPLFISAVLSYALTVFKVAQQVYDRLWKSLLKAK